MLPGCWWSGGGHEGEDVRFDVHWGGQAARQDLQKVNARKWAGKCLDHCTYIWVASWREHSARLPSAFLHAMLSTCIFLGLLAVFAVYHKVWFCSNMKLAQHFALAIACNWASVRCWHPSCTSRWCHALHCGHDCNQACICMLLCTGYGLAWNKRKRSSCVEDSSDDNESDTGDKSSKVEKPSNGHKAVAEAIASKTCYSSSGK